MGCRAYLVLVPHGPFPQDGHLGEGVLLQAFQGVSTRTQKFANKVKLQRQRQILA